MLRKTKIVATIGPATESPEILKKMIEAGMNVARFNTKHSEPAWHNERIQRVRDVANELKKPVAVLLDLQGPEIRINTPNQATFEIKEGELLKFTSNVQSTDAKFVIVPADVVASLSEDNLIILDDGASEFVIKEMGKDFFMAEAVHDCTIKHRKTLNTPGVVMDMPSLTERDYQYLEGVDLKNVDFVGLSFVRDAKDIEILREELVKHGSTADIIAKIEHQSGLDHLDEIIAVADAVMVARGDLGVEVPYEELIYWQKTIINKCRLAAKPVITATQMLKSMVESPWPTRAEVSDVAHAIYDGTDAIMLSDETTIGKYPVKTIQVMSKIALFNEKFADVKINQTNQTDSSSSIAQAAIALLNESALEIDKIVCLTETGRTAKLIARFRPHKPIFAVTSSEDAYRKLVLNYAVNPFVIELPEDRIENSTDLLEKFIKIGMVEKDETMLLISGTIWKQPGLTNNLAIIKVPSKE